MKRRLLDGDVADATGPAAETKSGTVEADTGVEIPVDGVAD